MIGLKSPRIRLVSEYLIVVLLIFFPIFKKGRVLLLDYGSIPGVPFSKFLHPNVIATIYFWLMNNNILGKILLVAAFVFLGVSIHRLVYGATRGNSWAAYFAGLLVIFNPWMYSRILYGQIGVVSGVVLLPLFFITLLEAHKRLSKKTEEHGNGVCKHTNQMQCFWGKNASLTSSAFFLALITTIIVSIMPAAIFFIFVALGIFSFSYVISSSTSIKQCVQSVVRMGAYVAMVTMFFVIMNVHLMIPLARGNSELANYVDNIHTEDINSFKTAYSEKHGVLWNTAAMYGFWGDREGRYAPLQEMVPYWFELYLAILTLSVWGVISSMLILRQRTKDKKAPKTEHAAAEVSGSSRFSKNFALDGHALWVVFLFGITAVVSLVLAVGIAHPWAAPLSWWLYRHVPFYKGFREPQKWVGLLVICYAYLGALGADDLIKRIQGFFERLPLRIQRSRLRVTTVRVVSHACAILSKIAPAFFLVIPLLYAPGMLGGFKGQVCVGDYPKSWFAVNSQLNKDMDDFRVLFVPWHQYLNLSFACHKIINNPASLFFTKAVIAGDNMEVGSVYTESTRPESKYIEGEILKKRDSFAQKGLILDKNKNFQEQITSQPVASLGDALLPLNIKYVVFAQESDFFNYTFVSASPDMELVYDSVELKVYRNKQWVPGSVTKQ